MVEVQTAISTLRHGLARRNREMVNASARDLLEARAQLGPQWKPIAQALANNREWTLALAAADRFAAEGGDNADAGYTKVGLLYDSGRLGDALALLDDLEARGLGPADAQQGLSLLNLRASILLLLGRTGEARKHLDDALSLDPRSGQAWFSLSELADFRGPDANYRVRLEDAYEAGPSLRGEAAKLSQATARMRHQLGDFEGAFAAFDAAAEQYRNGTRNESRIEPRLADQSISIPVELIQRVAARITVPHDRVIFVTGLPRSGTTLVEQILVSHPDVAHGEEIFLFRLLAQEIGGIDAASFSAWIDRGGDPNRLVELYMHLAAERFGPDGRFVDKSIEAGNYMGLLLALFPRAPIFWMRRDPIDNGWSAFRTMFARGAAWSWDQAHIGQRLAQEQQMIAHWSATAGQRITFVEYEALVRDPEPHIRKIASAAGLELDERMLRPHDTRRTVASASVSQVREPINLKGIGVAEPYREWLGPMIDAFETYSAASRA